MGVPHKNQLHGRLNLLCYHNNNYYNCHYQDSVVRRKINHISRKKKKTRPINPIINFFINYKVATNLTNTYILQQHLSLLCFLLQNLIIAQIFSSITLSIFSSSKFPTLFIWVFQI